MSQVVPGVTHAHALPKLGRVSARSSPYRSAIGLGAAIARKRWNASRAMRAHGTRDLACIRAPVDVGLANESRLWAALVERTVPAEDAT